MKYKFEDIIFNITEKKKPVEEDKYNYIGLEHLESDNLFISKWGSDTAPEGEKIVMKKGDVLFGKRRAYQKKVAISPIDGIFSAHGMVLRPKEDVICKEFLPFFISSEAFLNEAIRISVGGLSPTVNWKDIKELEFDLPSFAEQKVLAEKLWAAYEVKQSYLKMIAATEEMVKAQFVEMTGDPRTNPKSWPVKQLPELATYSIGLTYKPENISEDGTIVLRSGNIQNSKIDLTDVVRVNCPIKESIYVRKNDILMCSRNGSAALVGKVAQIKDIEEPMTYGAFMTVIRSDYSDYLYLYFQSKDFREQVSTGKSSTMNQITQNMLDKITLPLPGEDIIKKLSEILHQADKSISELRKSVDAIDKVIKSLINENL